MDKLDAYFQNEYNAFLEDQHVLETFGQLPEEGVKVSDPVKDELGRHSSEIHVLAERLNDYASDLDFFSKDLDSVEEVLCNVTEKQQKEINSLSLKVNLLAALNFTIAAIYLLTMLKIV